MNLFIRIRIVIITKILKENRLKQILETLSGNCSTLQENFQPLFKQVGIQ